MKDFLMEDPVESIEILLGLKKSNNMRFHIVARMGDENDWYDDEIDYVGLDAAIGMLRMVPGLKAFCDGREYTLEELEAMR